MAKKEKSNTRPGAKGVQYVKSSEFLPAVFQTDLNRSWLDSTFDQMISKAELENIDAYVGSKKAKDSKPDDLYLKENISIGNRLKKQLEPAVVTTSKNKTHMISVDDIANSIAFDFEKYNFNSAYRSTRYVYAPPVNYDMLVNFSSYYWIKDVPVYESTNLGKYIETGNGSKTEFGFADNRQITQVLVDNIVQQAGTDFNFNNNKVRFTTAPSNGSEVKLRSNAVVYADGPISAITNKATHTFIDDYNVFDLQEGMLLKFSDGYSDTYNGFNNAKVYMVSGVGDRIKFIEYRDENGKTLWTDYTQYKDTLGGYWDKDEIFTLSMKGTENTIDSIVVGEEYEITHLGDADFTRLGATQSTPSVGDRFTATNSAADVNHLSSTGRIVKIDNRGTTPQQIANAFNALSATTKSLGLSFNVVQQQKTVHLEQDMLVVFDETWQLTSPVDYYKIYKVDIDSTTGNITFITLINAQTNLNGNIEQSVNQSLSAKDTILAQKLEGKWDSSGWDHEYYKSGQKDYIIAKRACKFGSAWARSNSWMHRDTIQTYLDIMPGLDSADYFKVDLQARRPIIEFDANLEYMNHGYGFSTKYHGHVDFVIKDDSEIASMTAGATYVKLNDSNIYKKGVSGAIAVMNAGDTLLPLSSPTFVESDTFGGNREVYKFRDVWFDGQTIKLAQIKAKPNQSPYFKLTDNKEIKLDNNNEYPESTFRGNKIIGYKTSELQDIIDRSLADYGYVQGVYKGKRIRDILKNNYDLFDSTTKVDSELSLPLSYINIGSKADYQLQDFLNTEKYLYTVKTNRGNTIGKQKQIPGYYYYHKNNNNFNTYRSAYKPAGATEDLQVTVTQNANPTVLDIGYDAWRPEPSTSSYLNEFFFYEYRNNIHLSEITAKGVYNNRHETQPDIILREGGTYRFHDLVYDSSITPNNRIQFYTVDGLPYTTNISMSDANNDGDDDTYTLIAPAAGTILNYGNSQTLASRRNGKIIVVPETDYIWHELYINGKYTNPKNYTISNNSITVPESLLNVGDRIDLVYNPNNVLDSNNTNIPEVHVHNPKNKTLDYFTISETRDHWLDILRHTPDFDGDAFGINNTHKRVTNKVVGGTMFINNDISIMHDISMAVDTLDLSSAIIDQGNDWQNFKTRFVNETKKLYQKNIYSSVREIVDSALEKFVVTRRGMSVHQYTNMLYAPNDQYQKIEYTKIDAQDMQVGVTYKILSPNLTDFTNLGSPDNNIGTTFVATGADTTNTRLDQGAVIKNESFYPIFTVNSDSHRRDHLYIYLTENRNGKMIERLLVKGIDYTLNGSIINLEYIASPGNIGEMPFITVYWHDMNSESYIPASLAKLELAYGTTPNVFNRTFVGHDGNSYEIESNAELYDINHQNFDIVHACLFDLEKRAYLGMSERYASTSWELFMPSQHRHTWYTNKDINNYLEKHFKSWWRQQGKPELVNSFDTNDSRTWNYSSFNFGEHLADDTLPGHWRGAYITLFGTDTPHINPWNMLGIDRKPSWWDAHYPSNDVTGSWADTTKRDALKNALMKGITNDPALRTIQDLNYARYYWDWRDVNVQNGINIGGNFPVTTSGTLEQRHYILAQTWDPTNLPAAAASPYVFGDWSPVEMEWRNTSLGQAAMLDALLKLNPVKAMTEYFQPGVFKRATNVSASWDVNVDTKKLIQPESFYLHNEVYKKHVKRIEVRESSTGWGANTTVQFLDAESNIPAQGTVDVDENGRIRYITLTRQGLGYDSEPVLDIKNQGTGSDPTAYVDFKIIMGECKNHATGLAQIQQNKLDRDQQDESLKDVYANVDTKLMQKINGFTNKNIISFKTDSGSSGAFRISEVDFENYLYLGKPYDVVNCSVVKITKKLNQYLIDGISTNKQQFKFYEPIRKGQNFKNINVDDQAVVKKWIDFSSIASVLEFDAGLSKIQDVYDFIRGYYLYLESNGFDFGTGWNKDDEALSFATWAVEASPGDIFEVYLPDSITINKTQGHIVQFDSLPGNKNTLLTFEGTKIPSDDVKVTRESDKINLLLGEDQNSAKDWGCIPLVTILAEHAVLFSNNTQFNEKLFDSVKNIRQPRLRMAGKRTQNWDGTIRAPGYLISDNKIIENFDTSVRKIDDHYSYNIDNLNKGITRAENLSIGNVSKEWVKDFNLTDNTFGKFYQGVIRDQGTNSIVNKFNRSDLLNYGVSNVNINEEWMFRHSYFGETVQTKSLEYPVSRTSLEEEKVFDLSATNIDYVNDQRQPGDNYFDTESFDAFNKKYSLYSAGDLLENEADYLIRNEYGIKDVYDSNKDYATIPTWSGTKSYKRFDKVRKDGKLYQCNVDYIGYNTTPTDLEFTGSVVNPIFNFASQANGDNPSLVITSPHTGSPIQIWLDKQQSVDDTITALGSAGATALSPCDIVIDGYTINLSYTPLTTVVDSNPQQQTASLPTPTIADNTNKTLIINGVTVELYEQTGAFVPGSSLDIDDIVNFINSANINNVTASRDTVDNTKINIVYDVQGNINDSLVIGAGSANSDLGITAVTQPPSTRVQPLNSLMTPTIIAGIINTTTVLPDNYEVDVTGNNELRIRRSPGGNYRGPLTITVNGGSQMGIPTTTPQTQTVINSPSTVSEAASIINTALTNAGNTTVTASNVNNQLLITTTDLSIDLGAATNEVNSKAGLPAGIKYSTSTTVDNEFTISDWSDISDSDPALFNIWNANDSESSDTNNSTSGIQSKFYGWNVYQVQQGYVSGQKYTSNTMKGWFSADGTDPATGDPITECSICAGTATSDGNDARVSLNANHNLEVGDYVLILNSTTKPNCDGIHRVTRLGNAGEPNRFYIDAYIDKCGSSPAIFPLRNARFNNASDMNQSLTTDAYYWNHGDKVWITSDNQNQSSTNVYQFNNNGTFEEITDRKRSIRPTSTTIENVLVYDGLKQQTIAELEIFDPLRGIIPGIADREIDQRSSNDVAAYTDSTDVNFVGDNRSAWGEYEVGKTWWDTSNLVYFDYDQGDDAYKLTHWGKLFPGASIDVYEWTKSTVPPEEWETAVSSNTDMFGNPATGQVFSTSNNESDEQTYYYSEQTIWNNKLFKYETVYYFWVKGKTTIPNAQRSLSVAQIENIITDPSASGIGWFSPVDANKFIVKNINYYLTESSSVIQINKKNTKIPHNSWTLIKENTTIIPDYWYLGLRDNITGIQDNTNLVFPNTRLHPYNRFGDDRKLGQGWFLNTYDARREAVILANRMLKNINVIDDLQATWDRTIGYDNHVINRNSNVSSTIKDWQPNKTNKFNSLGTLTSTFGYVIGDEVKWNRKVYRCLQNHDSSSQPRNDFNQTSGLWEITASIYDLTKMWDYADYVSKDRNLYQAPSISISNKNDLDGIDVNKHQLVLLKRFDTTLNLDRSEIYHWNGTNWILVEKKNATIQFNDLVYSYDKVSVWDKDTQPWDSTAWDQDTVTYAYNFVTALRKDLFVDLHEKMFNKFFFGMVKYTINTQPQVDWAYKTTFIQLNIETPLTNKINRYKKNNINSLLGYINEYKPFHTKIRNVFDNYEYNEQAKFAIEDSDLKNITVQFSPLNVKQKSNATRYEFPVTYNGDTIQSTFTENTTDTYIGTSFTDTTQYDTISGGEFLNPYDYNTTSNRTWNAESNIDLHNPAWQRRFIVSINPLEHLSMTVQTNNQETDHPDYDPLLTRTFTYLQDHYLNVKSYILESAKSSTISQNSSSWTEDDTIPVTDETVFNATGGYAYFNGEIIRYGGTSSGKLVFVKRSLYGTIEKTFTSGDIIVDITEKQIDTFDKISYSRNKVAGFSVDGVSILDNNAEHQEAIQIQGSGPGVEI